MKVSKQHYSENDTIKSTVPVVKHLGNKSVVLLVGLCNKQPLVWLFMSVSFCSCYYLHFCDIPGEEALAIGDVCVPDTSVLLKPLFTLQHRRLLIWGHSLKLCRFKALHLKDVFDETVLGRLWSDIKRNELKSDIFNISIVSLREQWEIFEIWNLWLTFFS